MYPRANRTGRKIFDLCGWCSSITDQNRRAPVAPPSTAARLLVRLICITAEHREHTIFLNRTVPSGTTDNSPAIYCRGWPAGAPQVPLGTTEIITLAIGPHNRFARNRKFSPEHRTPQHLSSPSSIRNRASAEDGATGSSKFLDIAHRFHPHRSKKSIIPIGNSTRFSLYCYSFDNNRPIFYRYRAIYRGVIVVG